MLLEAASSLWQPACSAAQPPCALWEEAACLLLPTMVVSSRGGARPPSASSLLEFMPPSCAENLSSFYGGKEIYWASAAALRKDLKRLKAAGGLPIILPGLCWQVFIHLMSQASSCCLRQCIVGINLLQQVLASQRPPGTTLPWLGVCICCVSTWEQRDRLLVGLRACASSQCQPIVSRGQVSSQLPAGMGP